MAAMQDVEARENEADHVQPFSRGGATTVENGQLLTPNGNRVKSNNFKELRDWQTKFLDKWNVGDIKHFLCVAIPGGGKTYAALMVARHWLDVAPDRRVIVVVPTVNLRSQWRTEAAACGIELQTKEFVTDFKRGYQGAVMTYQSLDSWAALLRRQCHCHQLLVILDEPHHCAQHAQWGQKVVDSFELCDRMLLLSGTPFRSDGQPIPFVTYDGGGQCIWHDRYDYPSALQDHVVRYLTFDYSKGSYRTLGSNGEEEHEIHSGISDDKARQRLRRLLTPSGDFVQSQIKMAHDKLQGIRRNIPDAAAMAVCCDQEHAVQVAQVIKRLTGNEPSVIVSDDELATDTVDKFRCSAKQWLVSVRQVSEGTDIKRLQVLCYLTTSTTELFFRQLIGRVSRVRYREHVAPSDEACCADMEAYVYLPADPRLVSHAKNIENAQFQALRIPEESQLREQQEPRDSRQMFLGSQHYGTEMLIVSGIEYSPHEKATIEGIAETGGITVERAADVYEKHIRGTTMPMMACEKAQQPLSREEQETKLRRDCWRMGFRLAKLKGQTPQEVHSQWKPQATMSVDELLRKRQSLHDLIKREEKR